MLQQHARELRRPPVVSAGLRPARVPEPRARRAVVGTCIADADTETEVDIDVADWGRGVRPQLRVHCGCCRGVRVLSLQAERVEKEACATAAGRRADRDVWDQRRAETTRDAAGGCSRAGNGDGGEREETLCGQD